MTDEKREKRAKSFTEDKEVALFEVAMDVEDQLDGIEKAIKNIPKVEIPKTDFSEMNKNLSQIKEELQKPCEINIKLTLE